MFELYDCFSPTDGEKHAVCGRDSHGSTVTELPSGKIMATWYSGSYEKSADVGIYTARFDPQTKTWSEVSLLAKEGDRKSEGNPVIHYDAPTERLWLFWVTMDRADYDFIPGGWSTCKMKCMHSDDVGKTWREPRYLFKTWGKMTRNKPIRLSNGDFFLPIYSEWLGYKGNFLISKAESFAKGAQKSKWKKVGPVGTGVMQPTVVELEPGHLLAYFRTAKSSKFKGRMTKAESVDYGRHWTKIEPTDLPNPNSGCDMVKLANGNLALAFNNHPSERSPLSIGLSEDNGKTWPYIQDIVKAAGPGLDERFSYPSLIQAEDGILYCSYTNKHAINIQCARFDEDWVKTGS